MTIFANDTEHRATHHWDSRSWRLVLQDSVQSSVGLTRRPRLLSETSKFRSIITSWRLDRQGRKLLKRRASDPRRQTATVVLVTHNTCKGTNLPIHCALFRGEVVRRTIQEQSEIPGEGNWHVSAREPRSLRLPNHSNAAFEGRVNTHRLLCQQHSIVIFTRKLGNKSNQKRQPIHMDSRVDRISSMFGRVAARARFLAFLEPQPSYTFP